MTWKYALIKVAEERYIDENDLIEVEDICEIGEVYDENGDGEYRSFCFRSPSSLEALAMAIDDIERDGVNEYFFVSGEFKPGWCEHCDSSNWKYKSVDEKFGITEESD